MTYYEPWGQKLIISREFLALCSQLIFDRAEHGIWKKGSWHYHWEYVAFERSTVLNWSRIKPCRYVLGAWRPASWTWSPPQRPSDAPFISSPFLILKNLFWIGFVPLLLENWELESKFISLYKLLCKPPVGLFLFFFARLCSRSRSVALVFDYEQYTFITACGW